MEYADIAREILRTIGITGDGRAYSELLIDVVSTLKRYFHPDPAPKPETDGDARKLAERILQIADDLQDKWDGGDHADMFDKVTERYIDKITTLIQSHDAAILASHGQGDSETRWAEVGRHFCTSMPCGPADCGPAPCKYLAQAIANRNAGQGERALRVCGNCLHGRGTSLDDTRCYKATPYLPTGRHCEACADWEPCGTCANPKSAAPLASHDESDTIHNTGSVSHDNREPDGRKGE